MNMGFLVDEKKLVNDNIFLHEERINSQYMRFLDSTPTYVTYYHINNIESTVDNGFQNVERVIGENSPIRFNEIKNFPVYGIEQIVLGLNLEEHGLDTSYEGEGIILPNTIKPLPNDLFIISYLNQDYIFMISEVAYDTIKSNNFYRITFSVKYMEPGRIDDILRQTNDKFSTLIDNLGSKEKVIIRDDDIDQIMALDEIYTKVAEYYKLLFFNSKYNSFIFTQLDSSLYYDKYQTEFINKHGLFNKRRTYDTVWLTQEDKSPTMLIEYHNSIYRALELKKKSLLKDYRYIINPIRYNMSIFLYYRLTNVKSPQLMDSGTVSYIRPELIEKIISPSDVIDENVMCKTIIDYFNNKINTVYDIDRAGLREYMEYMNYDRETFILVPLLLYILRTEYQKFMTTT